MKPVVFDTNVWISGLVFKGRVREMLEGALLRRYELVASEAILEEVARVLGGRKFRYSHEVVAAVLQEIRLIARVADAGSGLRGVSRDPDDDKVLGCALDAGAGIVVSGDEDLLALKSFRGIRIMEPAAFLAEVEDGDEGSPPVLREKPAAYRARTKRKKA